MAGRVMGRCGSSRGASRSMSPKELAGIHPDLQLPYIGSNHVPPQHRKAFGYLVEGEHAKVIFFIGAVSKINRGIRLPSSKVLIVTHNSIMTFTQTGDLCRAIPVVKLKKVLASPDYWLAFFVEGEHDLLCSEFTKESVQKIKQVVTTIYQHEKSKQASAEANSACDAVKTLSWQRLPEAQNIKDMCNLKHSSTWKLEVPHLQRRVDVVRHFNKRVRDSEAGSHASLSLGSLPRVRDTPSEPASAPGGCKASSLRRSHADAGAVRPAGESPATPAASGWDIETQGESSFGDISPMAKEDSLKIPPFRSPPAPEGSPETPGGLGQARRDSPQRSAIRTPLDTRDNHERRGVSFANNDAVAPAPQASHMQPMPQEPIVAVTPPPPTLSTTLPSYVTSPPSPVGGNAYHERLKDMQRHSRSRSPMRDGGQSGTPRNARSGYTQGDHVFLTKAIGGAWIQGRVSAANGGNYCVRLRDTGVTLTTTAEYIRPDAGMTRGLVVRAAKVLRTAHGEDIAEGVRGTVLEIPGEEPGTCAVVEVNGYRVSVAPDEVDLGSPSPPPADAGPPPSPSPCLAAASTASLTPAHAPLHPLAANLGCPVDPTSAASSMTHLTSVALDSPVLRSPLSRPADKDASCSASASVVPIVQYPSAVSQVSDNAKGFPTNSPAPPPPLSSAPPASGVLRPSHDMVPLSVSNTLLLSPPPSAPGQVGSPYLGATHGIFTEPTGPHDVAPQLGSTGRATTTTTPSPPAAVQELSVPAAGRTTVEVEPRPHGTVYAVGDRVEVDLGGGRWTPCEVVMSEGATYLFQTDEFEHVSIDIREEGHFVRKLPVSLPRSPSAVRGAVQIVTTSDEAPPLAQPAHCPPDRPRRASVVDSAPDTAPVAAPSLAFDLPTGFADLGLGVGGFAPFAAPPVESSTSMPRTHSPARLTPPAPLVQGLPAVHPTGSTGTAALNAPAVLSDAPLAVSPAGTMPPFPQPIPPRFPIRAPYNDGVSVSVGVGAPSEGCGGRSEAAASPWRASRGTWEGQTMDSYAGSDLGSLPRAARPSVAALPPAVNIMSLGPEEVQSYLTGVLFLDAAVVLEGFRGVSGGLLLRMREEELQSRLKHNSEAAAMVYAHLRRHLDCLSPTRAPSAPAAAVSEGHAAGDGDCHTLTWVVATRRLLAEDIHRTYQLTKSTKQLVGAAKKAAHKLASERSASGQAAAVAEKISSAERAAIIASDALKGMVCNRLLAKEKWDLGIAGHPSTQRASIPNGLLTSAEEQLVKKLEAALPAVAEKERLGDGRPSPKRRMRKSRSGSAGGATHVLYLSPPPGMDLTIAARKSPSRRSMSRSRSTSVPNRAATASQPYAPHPMPLSAFGRTNSPRSGHNYPTTLAGSQARSRTVTPPRYQPS